MLSTPLKMAGKVERLVKLYFESGYSYRLILCFFIILSWYCCVLENIKKSS